MPKVIGLANYTCFFHCKESSTAMWYLSGCSHRGQAKTGMALPVSICWTTPWRGWGAVVLGPSSVGIFLSNSFTWGERVATI